MIEQTINNLVTRYEESHRQKLKIFFNKLAAKN